MVRISQSRVWKFPGTTERACVRGHRGCACGQSAHSPLNLLCQILGATAADAALTTGATRGFFLAGGRRSHRPWCRAAPGDDGQPPPGERRLSVRYL